MSDNIEINQKPIYRKMWFSTFLFFLFIIVILWTTLQVLYPTTSPINIISYFLYSKEHPHQDMSKQVIAFMPYWRVSDATNARFDLLTEINYFSLTIDSNGNFIQKTGAQAEPGWLKWNSQTVKDLIAKTQITGNKFSFTIACQKNKTLEAFLNNKKAQQNLITNVLGILNERHLNGVVIDFEYDGKPDDKYRTAFSEFASQLSAAVHTQDTKVTISLALLPLAGREKGLFDLPKIEKYFNRFIGMSYDYYAQGSDIAGPVAPMHGFKENKFFFDVVTTYADYEKYIPKNKLIMGIPYYGYDWAVVKGKKIQSATLPLADPNNYAAVISYGRSREDKDIMQNQCQWDEYAQEPWCWYTDKNGIDHQLWFENNKSIDTKYEFARQSDFAGAAIWTMGYDKNYPDLWNIIKSVLAK